MREAVSLWPMTGIAVIVAGFLNARNLPFILLIPPAVIGLLKRHGLKERASAWIARIRSATAGCLLIVNMFLLYFLMFP